LIKHRFSKTYPQKWIQIALLLGFCLVLYFLNLGQWDLWNPDEPRYAQVAREMVNGGDWILMHLNGKTYGDKPPLFFWLIGLSSYLWEGFTSFSARFPSALFGTLTVLITFFIGKRLFSSRTGFLSGLILATSLEFAYLSTRANIDAPLTFFTTTSLLFFLHWYRYSKEERGSQSKIKDLSVYGFYIAMALATLAKGPVGFILPLLVSLVYLLIRKDWKRIKRMRLLSGMLLFMVIMLSWYIPAVLKGGNLYLQETLFKHTVDAYGKGWTHVRPIYYYLNNFPIDFLPWFLFLPGAMVYSLSKRKEEISKDFLILIVWFVVIFLFFSFSKGKRAIYLLPLYPAASLLVGRFWDDYLSSSDLFSVREIWIILPVYLLIIIFFLMGMFLYVVPAVANFSIEPSTSKILKMIIKGAGSGAKYLSYVPRWSVIPFIFLLVGSSILLSLAHGLRYKSFVFILIVAMVGIGFFYGTRVIFPLVNPYKSARFISQEITLRIQPGEKVGLYGGFGTGPYNFYTGIVPISELEGREELLHFLGSTERVFCLLKFRDFSSFQTMERWPKVQLIARRKVGDDDIVLISNQ
jgi:4-amino-4-deoxy-L-arabinose transferase-like glycosyltransferase